MPHSILKVGALLLALVLLAACSSGPSTRPAASGETVDKQMAPVFALMAEGNYVAAEQTLLKLQRSRGDDAAYHLNLGIIYARTERLDDALAALQRARSITPRSAVVNNELGIVLRQSGDFPGAATAYRAAIAADAGYANAHYNLGVLLDLYLRQHSEALVHYEAYLSMSPQDDKTVRAWVKDLQRRTAQGPSTASQDQQVERR
ncbi:MAG: tetratricopeptide repeat protein [Gammaproteobacteria bacterium]